MGITARSFDEIITRPDFYTVLSERVVPWGAFGYECLICGKKISACSFKLNYMDTARRVSGLTGNARGAMTNHLKGHMRRGDV